MKMPERFTVPNPKDRAKRRSHKQTSERGRIMKLCLLIAVVSLFTIYATGQGAARTYRFDNGRWFNGKRFEKTTFYSIGGFLSKKKLQKVDETVDLKGGFVIPPFGDAHTHNLDGLFNLDRLIKMYMDEGTFYVQVLGNNSSGSRDARPKLNQPDTPDVVYANGMLTRTFGHPFMVYEPLAMGIYSPAEAYRRVEEVKKSRLALGGSYWFLDTVQDVDTYWSKILSARPDLI